MNLLSPLERSSNVTCTIIQLAHNYPSAIAEPCKADIAPKLYIALVSVDVQVLNHLVTGWWFYLQSAVCCKKDRRWLLIALTDVLALGPKFGPREQAGILIILLLAGRSGIKRSSFLCLVFC